MPPSTVKTNPSDPKNVFESHGLRPARRLDEGRSARYSTSAGSRSINRSQSSVMDGTRLVEIGTHDELIAKSGRYAELYGIQAAAYR